MVTIPATSPAIPAVVAVICRGKDIIPVRSSCPRRKVAGRLTFALVALCALFLVPFLAEAQLVPAELAAYEGQTISSVALAGRPDLDAAKYLPLLEQSAGDPFSEDKINSSVEALKATQQFTNVRPELLPEAHGVRVLFVLEPALYIGMFGFPGATGEFQYARLLQIADYETQQPYTADRVAAAQAALREFFNRHGFFQAEVKIDLKIDATHGLVNVVFVTKLGRRAKFGDIDVAGATPEETARLRAGLRSTLAVLRASSIKRGKNYNLGRIERATSFMESMQGKKGFLTAKVRFVAAEYDPETNLADLKFTLKSGPLVRVGVTGEHLWYWSRDSLIPMYKEHSIDSDMVEEGQHNLTSYLQSKGYFDAQVKVDQQHQGGAETVVYHVTRGNRSKVDKVTISGNHQISEAALREQISVRKKTSFVPFSHGHFSQQLLQSSVKNLLQLYRNSGFSDVKATSEVKTDDKDNLQVTFRVDEGPQDIVADLHISGNNAIPVEKLTAHGMKLGPGRPYSGTLVRDDRNDILAQYLRNGYLTATFQSKAKVDKQNPHRVSVTYEIYEGPQVITADVVTIGRQRTHQWLVDRALRIHAGAPLSENDVLASETKLYGLNIFDWASIDARQPVTEQPHADAIVKVHEAKPNTITFSVGFEIVNRGGSVPAGTTPVTPVPTGSALNNFVTSEKTFYGPRGTFSYTRNNVFGLAQSFTVGGFAGRLDQRFLGTYSIPYVHGSEWQMSGTLSGEHSSQNPIFSDDTADVGIQFLHNLNEKKTKALFLRYDGRYTYLTTLVIPQLVPPDQRRVLLSGPSASFVSDTRDNPLDAHRGLYHSYEFTVYPKQLGSNFSFARFLGQTAYYRKLPFAGVVWANSIRLGLAEGIDGSVVPISESFFSGGGSTLRGFSLNTAGPQRPIQVCSQTNSSDCSVINVPGGGNQLFILNSEFRAPVPLKKGLGVVAFYDGGNVFGHIGFHGGCGVTEHDEGVFQGCKYTNTVGLGARYETPIGPLRVDVGRNLNPVPGLTATQYFITLGQSF